MPESRWVLRAAFAVTASTTVLAGCSSDSSTPAPAVTVTETAPAATTAAATPAETPAETAAATQAAPSGLPTPPAGATVKESKEKEGMQYARYSITGTSAEDVVSGYESQFKAEGYSITNAGGSGGGWGKWGGSGYGMDASKDGSFASVQAGGSDNGPTYFEVCVGPDKSVVDQCGQQSQDEQNDSNSNGS